MLLLVVIQGPDKGRVFTAHPSADLCLGREPGDGALSDRRIGPRHARVLWSAGRWWVHAEAAGSGVSVNGRPSRVRAEVRSGDVLRLGGTTLVAAAAPGLDLERAALLDGDDDPLFDPPRRRAGRPWRGPAVAAALLALAGTAWLAAPRLWHADAGTPADPSPPAAAAPRVAADAPARLADAPPIRDSGSSRTAPGPRPALADRSGPVAPAIDPRPDHDPADAPPPLNAPLTRASDTADTGSTPAPHHAAAEAPSERPQPTLSRTELAYKLAFELGRPMPLGRGLTDPVTGEPMPPRMLQPSDALAEGFTHWRQWYEHDVAAQKQRLSELAKRYRQSRRGDPAVITLPDPAAPPRQPLALQPDPPADAERRGSSPLDASP